MKTCTKSGLLVAAAVAAIFTAGCASQHPPMEVARADTNMAADHCKTIHSCKNMNSCKGAPCKKKHHRKKHKKVHKDEASAPESTSAADKTEAKTETTTTETKTETTQSGQAAQ